MADTLCRVRLESLQRELASRQIGALLLTNPVNLRYATGVSVMPLWTAVNLARYALVPVEGEPVVFEYEKALFRTTPVWPKSRAATAWQFRFSQHRAEDVARSWAREIAALLADQGLAREPLGIDLLDHFGFRALEAEGLRLTDADEPLEAARLVKAPEEIAGIRRSCAVADEALAALEGAVRPGVSENELLSVFWGRMLALGGEYCSTRLLTAGRRTNPWFQEAGDHALAAGDLLAIDTDMIGPEGYLCDVSRTWVCGEHSTAEQREAYEVAYEFVQAVIALLKPEASYREIREAAPRLPPAYRAQSYSCMIHGCGLDDEPPYIPLPHDERAVVPRGHLAEGMVLSVECYAGRPGARDGVKLEEQVLITARGPENLAPRPLRGRLAALAT